jgi:osmoprotectant transport system permease protein
MTTLIEREGPSPGPPGDEDTVRSEAVRRKRFFTWRDVAIPLIVAVAIIAEVIYLNTAGLSQIERTSLRFEILRNATLDHLRISFTVTVFVLLIAVPVGVIVTRPRLRWLTPLATAFANIGQAVPSIGLIALFAFWWDIGFWPVATAVIVFALLPVLRNTIVGIDQIDPGVKDAARGMGMSPMGILFKVELPLAVPVIAAGARTSLVLAVATVPIGYFVGFGGLGNVLVQGIKLQRTSMMVAGALLVAALALLLDWLGGIVERLLTPTGIR